MYINMKKKKIKKYIGCCIDEYITWCFHAYIRGCMRDAILDAIFPHIHIYMYIQY